MRHTGTLKRVIRLCSNHGVGMASLSGIIHLAMVRLKDQRHFVARGQANQLIFRLRADEFGIVAHHMLAFDTKAAS